MKGLAERTRRRIAERIILFIAEDAPSAKPGKNSRFRSSLRNAIKGLAFTFLSERNFRFELVMFLLSITLGFLLGIDRLEWVLVLLSGFFVLALEAKNTSLELSVDLSTETYHYGAKSSKDSASGAVLLAALASLVTGCLIFGPRLLSKLSMLLDSLGAA
jgi:undecaprenol kinase